MSLQLRIYVPDHPLIKHWLAVARDENTPSILFKTAMVELGRWLTYEATRQWLPTLATEVKTPLAVCPATLVNPEVPVAVVPILRAGLAILEGAQTLLPLASIYHVDSDPDLEHGSGSTILVYTIQYCSIVIFKIRSAATSYIIYDEQ